MRITAAILITLLSGVISPAFGASVKNGDFEADAVAPWTWSKTDTCTATGELDKIEKHGGKQSFKMTSTSPLEANVYAGLSQRLELSAGKTYRATLWCKGKDVGVCWVGGGEGWGQRKRLPTGDFDWQQVSFTITTGQQDAYEFRVNVDSTTTALWVDDVEITDADAPAPPKSFLPSDTPGLSPPARLYPVPPDGPGPVLRLRSSEDRAFGADATIGYDADGMALDVKVFDPTPGPAATGEAMWEQDCIQIGIDTNPDAPKASYAGSCFELGFALIGANSVAHHAWYSGGGPFDFDHVRAEGSREDDGYHLKLHVGWASLNVHQPPSAIGLNLVVSDGQGGKGRRVIEWTPGIAKFKGPNEFARLERIAANAPSSARLRIDKTVYGNDDSIAAHFSEFAREDLGEEKLSLTARVDGGLTTLLADITVPRLTGNHTREVAFTVPADAIPEGKYILEVLSEARGAVAAVPFERLDLRSRIPAQLASLQKEFGELTNDVRSTPGAADDAYVRLATIVIDRFLNRVHTGGPNGAQDTRWSWLQLNETADVLAQARSRVRELRQGARPWVPAPVPTNLKIDDGLLAGKTEDGPSRPVFLYGYGHFGQVIKDLSPLANMGVTAVQQEIGPRSMGPDGTLGPEVDATVAHLRAAAAAGVRADVLLSPHYFPKWAIDASPDLAIDSRGSFLSFNIDHPKARDVIETYLRKVVPALKDEPALASLCLVNEPVYRDSGVDPYSRSRWTTYLRSIHSDIDVLNALYGTHYSNFESIPTPSAPTQDDIGQRRAYFDWIVFNQRNFAAWMSWMNGIVKQCASDVPTHVKVMPRIFERGRLSDGTDPELLCAATDLAGNDCWAYTTSGEEYAYQWKLEEAWYELLHSFRGQPVVNSENHLIPDGAGPESIPADHTRAVLWQGALHHQSETTIWLWEEASVPDLQGSIYFRPANTLAAGRAMLDVNRLAPELAAINRDRAKVAILYSVPSIYWQADYTRSLQDAFAAINMLGQPVTFISEAQLAESRRSPANAEARVIVVPHASHVHTATPAALRTFATSGGKVILLGDGCLMYDEYDRPLNGDRPEGTTSVAVATGDAALVGALRPVLADAGIPCGYVVETDGKPILGVEHRVVKDGDAYLVPMINFRASPLVASFHSSGGKATDLLTGESVDLRSVTLNPMRPRLLRTTSDPRL